MSELPKRWELVEIRDVTEYVQRGKSPKYTDKSELPVINQKCVRWDGVDQAYLKFIHPDQWNAWSSERFLREGDLLWNSTGTGTIGRAALFTKLKGYEKAVVDSHVTIVRCSKICLPYYLHYFVRSPLIQGRIEEMHTGSTNQVELSREEVLRTSIPLPPLNEQRRIVVKLDSLFARSRRAREELERIPKLCDRYKQAVLVAATSGEFAEDWQDVDIQSVAKVGTGSTPLRSNSSYYSDSGTPWITSAATGRSFVESATEFVTESAISDHRLKKYPVGTLLVAMYGEGKTRGQVTELRIEATINQACAAIVVNESLALKEYIKLSLQANYLEMRELAEGGNQPNLNLSKIKSFPLILPPLHKQKEIVQRVENLFKVIELMGQEYQKASKLCDRLEQATLAKAFRGELVPQDPNDEPAAALLERILAENSAQTKGKGVKSKQRSRGQS